MNQWPLKRLGELVRPSEQRDPRVRPAQVFSYVDIASVDNRTKEIVEPRKIPGADAPSRARKVMRAGDVIVSTVRPNLNAVALVPESLDGEICSTGFSVLRPSPQITSGYLFAVVRSPAFINGLVARTTGANYPAVNDGEVKEILIPVPPLAEQERIVRLLDEADDLRKLRAQGDRRAADLIPALFHEMFGDPERNGKGFQKKPLGDVIRVKSGEALTAKKMTAGGTFPVYGGNGVSGYHSEFMFEEPVIVLGRVGVYCGAVHLTQPKAWVTDNALYVSEVSEKLAQQYLVAALRRANLNQYAGRAAQPLVSGSRIYPVPILVPPLPLQQEFAQRVTGIRAMEAEQAGSRKRLDDLFQAMLHRAFESELS